MDAGGVSGAGERNPSWLLSENANLDSIKNLISTYKTRAIICFAACGALALGLIISLVYASGVALIVLASILLFAAVITLGVAIYNNDHREISQRLFDQKRRALAPCQRSYVYVHDFFSDAPIASIQITLSLTKPYRFETQKDTNLPGGLYLASYDGTPLAILPGFNVQLVIYAPPGRNPTLHLLVFQHGNPNAVFTAEVNLNGNAVRLPQGINLAQPVFTDFPTALANFPERMANIFDKSGILRQADDRLTHLAKAIGNIPDEYILLQFPDHAFIESREEMQRWLCSLSIYDTPCPIEWFTQGDNGCTIMAPIGKKLHSFENVFYDVETIALTIDGKEYSLRPSSTLNTIEQLRKIAQYDDVRGARMFCALTHALIAAEDSLCASKYANAVKDAFARETPKFFLTVEENTDGTISVNCEAIYSAQNGMETLFIASQISCIFEDPFQEQITVDAYEMIIAKPPPLQILEGSEIRLV
ncbi:MAG: hypothetical protein LBC42_01840 [Puniceicoccales bacterium]|jgi:hypothetical protein|nr:hypothetical protein [Puniceicoccales bacterium]